MMSNARLPLRCVESPLVVFDLFFLRRRFLDPPPAAAMPKKPSIGASGFGMRADYQSAHGLTSNWLKQAYMLE